MLSRIEVRSEKTFETISCISTYVIRNDSTYNAQGKDSSYLKRSNFINLSHDWVDVETASPFNITQYF